jgi:sugar phosphate isomerase/epimerase
MTVFSYQLYSSRNFPPLTNTFAMLKKHGYGQVEGYGALYASLDDDGVRKLKDDLDAAGLAMPTAHFGLNMLEQQPERALQIAEILGLKAVYCPYLQPEDRPKDAESWEAFGRRLERAGASFRDAGLIFGWHNHDFEFQQVDDGKIPQALIFEAAPTLSWEADIAWIVRGGADPLDWIERYGERITAVHVKDIAPGGGNRDEDGWADVGHGKIDWPTIMTKLRFTPAKYFIMEHDNPSDEERFASRSIASAQTY